VAAQTPELRSFYFQAQLVVEIEESVQFSEEVYRPQYFEEIEESVLLSEEINVLYAGIEESIIFSEEIDLTADNSRDIDETILFSEEVSLTTGFTPRLLTFYFQAKFEIAIEESVWFSEEVNPLLAAVSESVFFSEEIIANKIPRIDETVLFSEEVEAICTKTPRLLSFWFFGTEALQIETIYFPEDLEIWTDGVLLISESIVFGEAVERELPREIFEEVLLSESLEVQVVGLTIEEEFVFSEDIFPPEIVKIIEESVSFTEDVVHIPSLLRETIEFEELLVRQIIPSPIEEQVLFSEELELRQTISETIVFSEGVYPSQVGPIPESVYLQESITLDIVQSTSDQFYLHEEVKLQILRICNEQIFFSESVESAYGIQESIFFSEEIYQSRLSLDETFNLTEQVQRGIPVNLSESIYFEEEVVRQVEISEAIVFTEELWNNLRLIDEEIVFSEVLLREIHIWIGPHKTQVDLFEDLVFSEVTSFSKTEAISEQVLFTEEVESIFKEGVPGPSPFARKAVAAPEPPVEAVSYPVEEVPPVKAVSYPVAKVPPVVKRAYPSAEPVPLAKRVPPAVAVPQPVVKRVYPSAKPAPLPRRVPPAVAPEVFMEAPPPPKVQVERMKTRTVRMRITDNVSRYRVK